MNAERRRGVAGVLRAFEPDSVRWAKQSLPATVALCRSFAQVRCHLSSIDGCVGSLLSLAAWCEAVGIPTMCLELTGVADCSVMGAPYTNMV